MNTSIVGTEIHHTGAAGADMAKMTDPDRLETIGLAITPRPEGMSYPPELVQRIEAHNAKAGNLADRQNEYAPTDSPAAVQAAGGELHDAKVQVQAVRADFERARRDVDRLARRVERLASALLRW